CDARPAGEILAIPASFRHKFFPAGRSKFAQYAVLTNVRGYYRLRSRHRYAIHFRAGVAKGTRCESGAAPQRGAGTRAAGKALADPAGKPRLTGKSLRPGDFRPASPKTCL